MSKFADRLEALLRGATPGPWIAEGYIISYPNGGENESIKDDNKLIAFLVNNAPALLAVVKAAKTLEGEISEAYPGSSLEAALYHLSQALRGLEGK